MSETSETKKGIVTGLEQASDPKEAEYDLVKALLTAAEFKTSADSVTEVEIRRNGAYLFSVHVRPLSDPEVRLARKKATTYMPNPQGKKLPPIEKEFDYHAFNSWVIYLGTTEEDQKRIWGQKAVMEKYGLALPVESIDVLLNVGEKQKLVDTVMDISDGDDGADKVSQEEYAGN